MLVTYSNILVSGQNPNWEIQGKTYTQYLSHPPPHNATMPILMSNQTKSTCIKSEGIVGIIRQGKRITKQIKWHYDGPVQELQKIWLEKLGGSWN